MRLASLGIALCALLILIPPALAQQQPPNEKLNITAKQVYTWFSGRTAIVQLEGGVEIETDRATLKSDSAVLWLSPIPGALLDEQRVEVVLVGDASIVQPNVTRTGDRLFVTAAVRGAIRMSAPQRMARDRSDSEIFLIASAIRTARTTPTATPGPGIEPRREWNSPSVPAQSAPPAAPVLRPAQPVSFLAKHVDGIHTADGKYALVLRGGVTLIQHRPGGDMIELYADNAVVFTQIKELSDLEKSEEFKKVEDAVAAAYLEGDVRIIFTPGRGGQPEQRMRAQRVYYEFGTDRAILTDAVIHTTDPTKGIPVFVRAQTVRQLAMGEYSTDKVQLSTSSFATPTYSINADRAYVRQVDTGDPEAGHRTTFNASNVTLNMWGAPVFWLPVAGGSMTDHSRTLRNLQIGDEQHFGPYVQTEWGLFETFGKAPPKDLDITYRADYYGDRGPATGVDAKYAGGFVSELTGQPWNFDGDLKSFLVNDRGMDNLGGSRPEVEPENELRGRIVWEHQHFFPNDWQAQLRAGYTSDPTFLPSWFRDEFNDGQEQELALYIKKQRDSEAFTLLGSWQPNTFVTTADQMQEQTQVERLPEIGYHRIGDSLADDRISSFTDATIAGLRFDNSRATLAEQGFPAGMSPGIPSIGQTGMPDETTYRLDVRQQFDYPVTASRFRVVPYVFGRYTGYSDSPDGQNINRLFVGGGIRMTTAFWKVNDQAKSDLFDIHRVRHVIEPELNLFTSAQSADQQELFHYDSQIDEINDVSAAQIALRQRWQTKRGGPGRWRNVDFLSLNVEGNFFLNQPPADVLNPTGFRGLFFPTAPETSVPRNSVNADSTWRVSDTTAILADMSMNLDQVNLATGAIGLAVSRGDRVSYFLGLRYIDELDSSIETASMNYRISTKYDVALSQSYNFGQSDQVSYGANLIRRFDRFFVSFKFYYDQTNDQSGFAINLFSNDIGHAISTDPVRTVFGNPE